MDLDWKTVALEIVNFVVLAALLARYLFRPVRAVLQARRSEIERAREEATAACEEARSIREDYERRRRELERAVEEELIAARRRGEETAEATLAAAREEARRQVSAAEAEIAAAQQRAEESVRAQVTRVVADATGRLVAGLGGETLTRSFAARAARMLRANLAGDDPPRITLWLATDGDEAAVVEAVREVIPGATIVEVHRDPELVAGVRLVAHGVEVEASVGAALRPWLAEDDRVRAELAA